MLLCLQKKIHKTTRIQLLFLSYLHNIAIEIITKSLFVRSQYLSVFAQINNHESFSLATKHKFLLLL